MLLTCPECKVTVKWTPSAWRCDCGAPWGFDQVHPFAAASTEPRRQGLWRYESLLQLPQASRPVTMGEGWTPLVRDEFAGLTVHWKLEYLNPTSSYKDRGIAPLMTALSSCGVTSVVEDSSGNAGASVAAYAARAGIQATIFVPTHASPAKRAQIGIYGARVVPVTGSRIEATRAAEAALGAGVAYASHVWQAPVMAGLQTLAWEVWEQMGQRVPDWLVLPVGQGTLLLGVYLGFRALEEAGLSDRSPRLVAVQAARCDPLYAAWVKGTEHVQAARSEGTVAEGIRIVQPVRGQQVLGAIRQSAGAVLIVGEDEILAAQSSLARRGLYIEPTSAAAVAALAQLSGQVSADHSVVVPLTGSGLKGAPTDHVLE